MSNLLKLMQLLEQVWSFKFQSPLNQEALF